MHPRAPTACALCRRDRSWSGRGERCPPTRVYTLPFVGSARAAASSLPARRPVAGLVGPRQLSRWNRVVVRRLSNTQMVSSQSHDTSHSVSVTPHSSHVSFGSPTPSGLRTSALSHVKSLLSELCFSSFRVFAFRFLHKPSHGAQCHCQWRGYTYSSERGNPKCKNRSAPDRRRRGYMRARAETAHAPHALTGLTSDIASHVKSARVRVRSSTRTTINLAPRRAVEPGGRSGICHAPLSSDTPSIPAPPALCRHAHRGGHLLQPPRDSLR